MKVDEGKAAPLPAAATTLATVVAPEELPRTDTRFRRRVAWLLFALLSAVYLLTGKGFTELLDAEGYYLITKAIVERGEVSVVPELTGNVLAAAKVTNPETGGVYLHYGVGYPLVMVPFYVVGKALGDVAVRVEPRLARFDRFFTRAATSAALAFVTAGAAVAVYYLLLLFGMAPIPAVAGALIFGLATYAWPYAKIGFYEPFLALCQVLALVWAVMYQRTQRAAWLLPAGFVVGWGIAAKPSLIFLVPVLALYVVWAAWRGAPQGRGKRLIAAALCLGVGLAVWAGVFLWYNAQRTGVATHLGYSKGNYMPEHRVGRIVEALYGNAFSTGRGLFIYTPIFLMSFMGLPWLWRKRRAELMVIVALIIINYGFFALRLNWATIRPWGPRYLLPLAPLLTAMAVAGMVYVWRSVGARFLVYLLLIASLLVQLLAISMPFGTWLDRVKEETGSGFSAVFNPEYCPIYGQLVLLTQARLGPIDMQNAGISQGEPTEEFKTELRMSPDFWAAYMYRLGIPPVLVLVPVAALLLAIIVFAALLARALRDPRAHVATTEPYVWAT